MIRTIPNDEINSSINADLIGVSRNFSDITMLSVQKRHFGLVQLNSNNYFYDFLLKICELIHDCLFISEQDGKNKFPDFLRDEKTMMYLFEEFVRNFYHKEQSEFRVAREHIEWQAESLTDESKQYLPKMMTDVSLTSGTRKIIIDTKYYREALKVHHDKEKIHSQNLYQIFAYVKNIPQIPEHHAKCEGMLLYPTVKEELNLPFSTHGHKITIRTINLNQEWKTIHRNLLEIIQ